MAYTLIPFPLSILFSAVVVVAVIAILWRLSKGGKFYRILFYAVLAAVLLFLTGIAVTWATVPPPILEGPVVVQVSTDKASYVLGQPIQISVYANNTNDFAVKSPSLIVMEVSNGDVYGTVNNYQLSQTVLNAHYDGLLKLISWTPTTPENSKTAYLYSPGNYTITIIVDGPSKHAQCHITLTPIP